MTSKKLAPQRAPDLEPSDKKQARRVATEARLVAAVGQVLQEQGVEALGVNAVAATARVDNALIYRYFNDWDGLLRAYGQSAQFWPSLDEILGSEREVLRAETLGEVAAQILLRHERALRSRPATVALMRWECSHQNELTHILADARGLVGGIT